MAKSEMNPAHDTNEAPLSRAELEQQIRVRADKDASFRTALKADPKGTLERDYAQWFPNGKVPAGKTITVTEEDEHSIHLVLLPTSSEISGELLETVHGGLGLGNLGKSVAGRVKAAEDRTTRWHCGGQHTLSGACGQGTKNSCADAGHPTSRQAGC